MRCWAISASMIGNTIGNLVAGEITGSGRSRSGGMQTGAGDGTAAQPTPGAGGGRNGRSASSDAQPGDIVVTARRSGGYNPVTAAVAQGVAQTVAGANGGGDASQSVALNPPRAKIDTGMALIANYNYYSNKNSEFSIANGGIGYSDFSNVAASFAARGQELGLPYSVTSLMSDGFVISTASVPSLSVPSLGRALAALAVVAVAVAYKRAMPVVFPRLCSHFQRLITRK